jgi:hypothetical protein
LGILHPKFPSNANRGDFALFPSAKFQLEFSSIIDKWEDELRGGRNALEIVLQLIELNEIAGEYDVDVEFCARGTVFFTTSKGYMGKGPVHAQAGDVIMLIAGLKMPLIARRVENKSMYCVVGGAYVHGFMDGEKWPDDEAGLTNIVFY